MTGFMHMETSGTEGFMNGLSQTGQHLASTWQRGKSTIADGESGIGSDLLAQAFRGVYLPASTAARQAADQVPASILADADAGAFCVGCYGTGDQRAAAAFPAVH
ncbi:hypothetical protein [Actinokineospora sp.]|uniref:hypothetical protein n=1 Tax=Actinokineospora sp. TaxID=1872133 RepID=UPI0040381BFE